MKNFMVAAVAGLCLYGACAAAETYEERIAHALQTVDGTVAQGPFRASWDSLETYLAPQWYKDAKFGMFIHWGVYSVPAFDSEWYPCNRYLKNDPAFKHHVETFGPQSTFGYKDFIPRFTAAKFDAHQWAELFRKAGAKFVVPVAEHHDGFPMYDCSFTDYSAAKMGPKQDIVGELAAAVRKQGMHFGASSHRAEHWWFYEGGMQFDSDVRDPRSRVQMGLYGPAQPKRLPGADHDNDPDEPYLHDWLARTTEIVDKYHPDLIWFDWWIEEPAFTPYLQKFAAFYYNRGAQWKKGVAINYKHKAFPERAAVLDIERGQLPEGRPLFWQTDTSISVKSWGYIENDQFKTADSIVDQLVDISSKNGALLLNIGPRPDGTIPEQAQSILLDIGKWLAVKGDSIYGTRPWKVFGEGPTQGGGGSFKDTDPKPFTGKDIRFTTKGNTLYAIALAWPDNGKLVVKSLRAGSPNVAREIKSVQLLGYQGKLKFVRAADGLTVDLPAQKPNDYAYAFKIE